MIIEEKKHNKREYAEMAWGRAGTTHGVYSWQCDECGYRSHKYDKMATIRLVEREHDCKSGHPFDVSQSSLFSQRTTPRRQNLSLSVYHSNIY